MWGLLYGGRAFRAWGMNFIMTFVQQVLLVDLFTVYFIHIATQSAIVPRLQSIRRVLEEVALQRAVLSCVGCNGASTGFSSYYSATGSSHDLYGNSNTNIDPITANPVVFGDDHCLPQVSLVQHISPVCRVARKNAFSSLAAAHLLLHINDADVYACTHTAAKFQVNLGLITTLLLAIPAWISTFNEPLAQPMFNVCTASIMVSGYVIFGFLMEYYTRTFLLIVGCLIVIKILSVRLSHYHWKRKQRKLFRRLGLVGRQSSFMSETWSTKASNGDSKKYTTPLGNLKRRLHSVYKYIIPRPIFADKYTSMILTLISGAATGLTTTSMFRSGWKVSNGELGSEDIALTQSKLRKVKVTVGSWKNMNDCSTRGIFASTCYQLSAAEDDDYYQHCTLHHVTDKPIPTWQEKAENDEDYHLLNIHDLVLERKIQAMSLVAVGTENMMAFMQIKKERGVDMSGFYHFHHHIKHQHDGTDAPDADTNNEDEDKNQRRENGDAIQGSSSQSSGSQSRSHSKSKSLSLEESTSSKSGKQGVKSKSTGKTIKLKSQPSTSKDKALYPDAAVQTAAVDAKENRKSTVYKRLSWLSSSLSLYSASAASPQPQSVEDPVVPAGPSAASKTVKRVVGNDHETIKDKSLTRLQAYRMQYFRTTSVIEATLHILMELFLYNDYFHIIDDEDQMDKKKRKKKTKNPLKLAKKFMSSFSIQANQAMSAMAVSREKQQSDVYVGVRDPNAVVFDSLIEGLQIPLVEEGPEDDDNYSMSSLLEDMKGSDYSSDESDDDSELLGIMIDDQVSDIGSSASAEQRSAKYSPAKSSPKKSPSKSSSGKRSPSSKKHLKSPNSKNPNSSTDLVSFCVDRDYDQECQFAEDLDMMQQVKRQLFPSSLHVTNDNTGAPNTATATNDLTIQKSSTPTKEEDQNSDEEVKKKKKPHVHKPDEIRQLLEVVEAYMLYCQQRRVLPSSDFHALEGMKERQEEINAGDVALFVKKSSLLLDAPSLTSRSISNYGLTTSEEISPLGTSSSAFSVTGGLSSRSASLNQAKGDANMKMSNSDLDLLVNPMIKKSKIDDTTTSSASFYQGSANKNGMKSLNNPMMNNSSSSSANMESFISRKMSLLDSQDATNMPADVVVYTLLKSTMLTFDQMKGLLDRFLIVYSPMNDIPLSLEEKTEIYELFWQWIVHLSSSPSYTCPYEDVEIPVKYFVNWLLHIDRLVRLKSAPRIKPRLSSSGPITNILARQSVGKKRVGWNTDS